MCWKNCCGSIQIAADTSIYMFYTLHNFYLFVKWPKYCSPNSLFGHFNRVLNDILDTVTKKTMCKSNFKRINTWLSVHSFQTEPGAVALWHCASIFTWLRLYATTPSGDWRVPITKKLSIFRSFQFFTEESLSLLRFKKMFLFHTFSILRWNTKMRLRRCSVIAYLL